MTLFSKSNPEPTTEAAPAHRRSPSTSSSTRRGLFRRRNRSPASDSSSVRRNGSAHPGNGLLKKGNNFDLSHDPTTVAARQKVTRAEAAEKDADKALAAARAMVREAREHVKILEVEALEE